MMPLTPTHEDYIEAVLRWEASSEEGLEGARVTDLAQTLGCRLPTVTRTVRVLAEAGYFQHSARKRVRLTERGRRIAEEIAHRHDDVVEFLVDVLGLTPEQAETDACQIEHGLSPLAASRLHSLLEHLGSWTAARRARLRSAVREGDEESVYDHLTDVRAQGWRA